MLDHFSRSELACPTTDELRLASGFGEALERLRVELDAPIYLNSACRSPQQCAPPFWHRLMGRCIPRPLVATGPI